MQIIDENLSQLYGLEGSCQLTAYIHTNSPEIDINRRRKALVIFPGGGYAFLSDREGEPVAMEFYNRDYNVFVVKYSLKPVVYPLALTQAACAVDYVRLNCDKLGIIKDKVFILGFSAGGHLSGNLCVEWDNMNSHYPHALDCRPDAAILSYPVVNDSYGHKDSFANLTGKQQENYRQHAVDLRVKDTTPPIFIWHGLEDSSVPVAHSLALAQALNNHNIKYELHIFGIGGHGTSLCDSRVYGGHYPDLKSMSQWYALADEFIKRV